MWYIYLTRNFHYNKHLLTNRLMNISNINSYKIIHYQFIISFSRNHKNYKKPLLILEYR